MDEPLRRWPPPWGCRGRRCMLGWPSMRPAAWNSWRIARTGRVGGSASDASGGGGGGVGGPPEPSIVGAAADRVRTQEAQSGGAGHRVGGVSVSAAGGASRAGRSAAPPQGVETVGAWPAERVVAVGCGRRFLVGRRRPGEGVDRVDDHSRFCVSAKLMARERTQPVCDGLTAALKAYGPPEQILTDNGKVFTGKYAPPPVEVLFDKICRENGIDHLLTQPRSPTTTGKIERFHRTLRAELDTRRTFASLGVAQQALDEWVGYYNTARPHQALSDATPAERFQASRAVDQQGSGSADPVAPARPVVEFVRATDREADGWVSRKVGRNGIVCVGWQQVSVGNTAPAPAATCWSPT